MPAMPRVVPMSNTTVEVELWYGAVLVGQVHDAFESDATWYGVLHPSVRAHDGDLQRQVVEYITFSEDWNERNCRAAPDAPDAAEFDAYMVLTRFPGHLGVPRLTGVGLLDSHATVDVR